VISDWFFHSALVYAKITFALLELAAGCYSAANVLEKLEITNCDLKFETSFPYGKDSDGCREKS
jgi:hypothetical protein